MDTSFHYTTAVLRAEVGKANWKCPNKTLNGLFQKNFQAFYFTTENSLYLTLPPSLCFFPITVFLL